MGGAIEWLQFQMKFLLDSFVIILEYLLVFITDLHKHAAQCSQINIILQVSYINKLIVIHFRDIMPYFWAIGMVNGGSLNPI